MNLSEKLLNQVIEGETDLPLPGDPLKEAFDELLKYGLIAVEGERMILTKRGEEAKLVGRQKVIDQLKTEEEMTCFSEKAQQKEFNLFRVSLICCFILLLLILMFNMKG